MSIEDGRSGSGELDVSKLEINAEGALEVLKGAVSTRASMSRRIIRLRSGEGSTTKKKDDEEAWGKERQKLGAVVDTLRIMNLPEGLGAETWGQYIDQQARITLENEGLTPLDMPEPEA